MSAKVFDCIYGSPGSGKSEACARLIEHVFKTQKKLARVCVGDGSALTYQHLVDAGICELVDFSTMPWPQDTMQKLSDGWWPDAHGILAKTDPAKMSTIGVYIFEGLSVAGSYIMGNVKGGLADRSGRGEKIGQDSPIRIIEGDVDPKTGKTSGPGTSFGGNPPTHYNVAQNSLQDCLQRSKALPMDYVVWVAHEADNNPDKDVNKESLVGPASVGKALTGIIQRNFNNTVHAVSVSKKVKMTDPHTGKAIDQLVLEYRLYTEDHFSASGATTVRFKACTRGVSNMPPYLVSKEPGMALLEYYQRLNDARMARVAQLTGNAGLSV